MTDHYTQYSSLTENKTDGTFEVVFENPHSQSHVKLSIPIIGAFENPNQRIDQTKVAALAIEIGKLLNKELAK